MSYQELYGWYDYYAQEPFMADRLEIQMANICQMISSFGKSRLKHSDFMISGKRKEKQTLKEFEDDLKAKFSMFAKIKEN